MPIPLHTVWEILPCAEVRAYTPVHGNIFVDTVYFHGSTRVSIVNTLDKELSHIGKFDKFSSTCWLSSPWMNDSSSKISVENRVILPFRHVMSTGALGLRTRAQSVKG